MVILQRLVQLVVALAVPAEISVEFEVLPPRIAAAVVRLAAVAVALVAVAALP